MEEREEYKHLSHLKNGSLHSFKWLYGHYYEKVYYFCLSMARSQPDAEEITSDVFVTIWNKKEEIDPSTSLRPLLFKITRDLTWNYLKRVAGKKGLIEKFIQNYSRTLSLDGEDDILFREYLDIMDKALNELTPQQQKIFRLRFLNGKELTQIAAELNISKNTVRVHLTNSKRLVLDYLRVHAF